jgi:hypothetical protein
MGLPMKIYHFSYDLWKPGQNYDALIEEIKRSAGWCAVLKSTWLIATNEPAQQLSERLGRHLDKNDSWLVMEASRNYSGWLAERIWTWLRESLAKAA